MPYRNENNNSMVKTGQFTVTVMFSGIERNLLHSSKFLPFIALLTTSQNLSLTTLQTH